MNDRAIDKTGDKRPVKTAEQRVQEATDWWSTSIIDIKPGRIGIRGYPIEELIGTLSFPQMVWLMLRGDLPSAEQGALLEAAMVAGVDHGPHAPSIAIARMGVTCGLPLNGAMASAINVLDDVHGGAGQQCMELLQAISDASPDAEPGPDVIAAVVDDFIAKNGKIIPGFGHRWHKVDPRSGRLLQMVRDAEAAGIVDGRFGRIALGIEALLESRKGAPIPMNIDGATAVIYLALGFAPPLGRGIFILSRSVGILAHAWEQTQQGGRIKGPMAPSIPYRYTGPAARSLAPDPATSA
ncbi:citryl-CoA lyase [Piscinibacter koreensis]|uniref:citrate synthase (unknown stereospecificity) n=1 Tax=Piscinibacter koreensis TaxID=2742824 RepID=A0A7Y6TYC2_9BURK|nr:citryl-CoA lyase [Schlegelella koreensis]NUZ08059.1 citryl-CoA lyase [Schlegelella koreensis]